MRSAPLNYLLTLGLAVVLWIVFSFVLGNYLADNVSLLQATIEEFVGTYRTAITAAAIVGVLLTFVWYFLGGKPEAAKDMKKASRLWMTLLLTAFAAAVVTTIGLVVLFGDEQFTLLQYVVFFLAASALTWLLYWVSTVVWSPRAVMNTMPPRR
jgi:hypothetical protein